MECFKSDDVFYDHFDSLDTQNLLALVTSMLAFSHYANEDYDKVLTTLQERVEGQDVGFNDLYLKG